MTGIFKGLRFNIKALIMCIVISVLAVQFNHERWTTEAVIKSDIANYYAYLPAAFYENDLTLSFLNDTINTRTESRYYQPNLSPSGNYVIKTTMGLALGYLPFFVCAHAYAHAGGFAVNGFSQPYHFAVLISSLFYFVIGLLFLYKILRIFFRETTTLLVLTGLCFGTNIFYYLTIGAGMPHIFNFALASVFIFYCIQWHSVQNLKYAIVLGLVGGLLVLIRPVNILLFGVSLLYDVTSIQGLKLKFRLIFNNKIQLLVIVSCSLLVCLPQLLYWKFTSGNYFFNSYVGERFYFMQPHIADGLFSFRKGWLVYTPLMTFAVLGFYLLYTRVRSFYLAIPIFFIVYIYVVFSWWCWWYGGSFGQRVLIDIYPLLAIPMAALFEKIIKKSKRQKTALYITVLLFIVLNLFQTVQAKYNIIHYDSMTRQSYMHVFFTMTKSPDREKYLMHPNYAKALAGDTEE